VTEKNKHENMKEELARASVALGAADLLHQNGFNNEAVSRLYYYLLYGIRAVLLSEGLEPRSHEGVLRLSARFPPESAHLLSKLMKYREEVKALSDRIDGYLVFCPRNTLT
jgi:uncharacterized protein (UPF0332 family)